MRMKTQSCKLSVPTADIKMRSTGARRGDLHATLTLGPWSSPFHAMLPSPLVAGASHGMFLGGQASPHNTDEHRLAQDAIKSLTRPTPSLSFLIVLSSQGLVAWLACLCLCLISSNSPSKVLVL